MSKKHPFFLPLSLSLSPFLPPAVQVTCGFEGSTGYIAQETSDDLELCVSVPAGTLRFNFSVNFTTVDGSASEPCTQLNV